MQRAHLTVTLALLALVGSLVARELDASSPSRSPVESASHVEPWPIAPPSTTENRRAWSTPPPTLRRQTWTESRCDETSTVVVAQELSRSMFEGRELPPTKLVNALSKVRGALPGDVPFGVVGFAQRLWTGDGPSTDPSDAAWLELTDPEPLEAPGDATAIGECANLALGLDAALTKLEASEAGARHLWLVVDGLHDCRADGRFAYRALEAASRRAATGAIDVSVLLVDAWSERRGPTPLRDLVRGRGRLVRTPAWELDEGFEQLVETLTAHRCR